MSGLREYELSWDFIRYSKLTGSHLKPYTKGSRWKGKEKGIEGGGGRGERREKGEKEGRKGKGERGGGGRGRGEKPDFFITEV